MCLLEVKVLSFLLLQVRVLRTSNIDYTKNTTRGIRHRMVRPHGTIAMLNES
jgi:hypothetical protein